ncbi:MAG: hypothetical protein ACK58J_27095, partial [Planctomyces sp.]
IRPRQLQFGVDPPVIAGLPSAIRPLRGLPCKSTGTRLQSNLHLSIRRQELRFDEHTTCNRRLQR